MIYQKDTSLNTLYHHVLTASNLARALSEVYLSISTSKIAHVFLDDGSELSLQIPQVTSIAELPSTIEPQMPGVWVTTANSLEDEENLDGLTLAKHFALLLLDDVENILKDIDLEYVGHDEHENGDGERKSGSGTKSGTMSMKNSHALARFVQLVRPTMSYVLSSHPHSFFPFPSHFQFLRSHRDWTLAY